MKFRFDHSEPVKENVVSFIFEPEQSVSWQPGQYFHYNLPHPEADDRGIERWFTNAAAPSENHVMISTRIDKDHGSSFKRALSNLKPGDEVEVEGPEGSFVVEDYERNYIFVAGGIGITPFRSILTEAHATGKTIKATVLYANRTHEIPFAEELEKIARDMPSLIIEYIVQPQTIDVDLLKRYIDATEDPFIYISGPEPMVKSLAGELGERGIAKESIKTDDFPGYTSV